MQFKHPTSTGHEQRHSLRFFHGQTQANTTCSSSKRCFDALLHVFNILNSFIRACDVSSSSNASSTSNVIIGSCIGYFHFFCLARKLVFADTFSMTILKLGLQHWTSFLRHPRTTSLSIMWQRSKGLLSLPLSNGSKVLPPVL